MTLSSRRFAILTSAVLFAAFFCGGVVYAGEDSEDWAHVVLAPSTGVAYDLAAKPTQDGVVGVAFTRVIESPLPMTLNIEYWEFDETGMVASEVAQNIPLRMMSALSLAYTSSGRPALAWVTENTGGGPDAGTSSVYYCRQLSGGSWTDAVRLDTFDGYGVYDNVFPAEDGGMPVLDMCFDRRPSNLDEVHIVYGGRFLYLTYQEWYDGDPALNYSALFALHAPFPGGPWSIDNPDIVAEFSSTASLLYPYASLATCDSAEPQLVFNAPEDSDAINYAVFAGSWSVDSGLLAGTKPSLALDPFTGEPRIAYSGQGNHYFARRDGGVWATPELVRAGSVGSQSLAIATTSTGQTVMKLAVDEDNLENGVYVYEYTGGAWSLLPTSSRVVSAGHEARIALKPNEATDPWVLVVFNDGLGLADYGEVVGGCGAAPVQRSSSAVPSAWKAMLPLLAAVAALAFWKIRRRKSPVLN